MMEVATLGLVPNGPRTVKPVPERILNMVPLPVGINENIKATGADPIRHTVPLIQKLTRRQAWQGTELAKHLKGSTLEETLRNNWNFFFRHIQYKKDEEGKEQVRSLRRLVHNASEGGDCDCFVNGLLVLLLNQGITNARLRVAKYDGSTAYSHIYIVVPKKSGAGYYTLDPVVHQFNYEVPFTDKKDFAMKLESLDGMPIEAAGYDDYRVRGKYRYGLNGLGCGCSTANKQGGAGAENRGPSTYYASSRQLFNDGLKDMKSVLTKRGVAYTDNGMSLTVRTTNGALDVPAFVDMTKAEEVGNAIQQETVATESTNATMATLKAGMDSDIAKTAGKALLGITVAGIVLSIFRPGPKAA